MSKTIGEILDLVQFVTGKTRNEVAEDIGYDGATLSVKRKIVDPGITGLMLRFYKKEIIEGINKLYSEYVLNSTEKVLDPARDRSSVSEDISATAKKAAKLKGKSSKPPAKKGIPGERKKGDKDNEF